ncbi:MAG: hypothetical protein Q4E37_01385 [Tissierellia bacterium]|nr:hypothetical protein [Tissierellia bacterium]
MSDENKKKPHEELLIKLALITALISLAENIIELIMRLLEAFGAIKPLRVKLIFSIYERR